MKTARFDPNMQFLRKYNPRWLILVTWMLVNLFLLARNGIITSGESLKYIRQADEFLKHGALGAPNFRLYLVQILLLAGAIKTGLGFIPVVLVQLAINLWAVFSFYRLLRFVFENENLAIAGSILLLVSLPYQEFNTMLQTESLFYSFTVIFSSYLLRIMHWTWVHITGIAIWLIILSLTRPTGLLMIPPTIAYLILVFSGKMRRWSAFLLTMALSLFFLALLDWALGLGGELDFMLPFRTSQVLCGVEGEAGTAHLMPEGNPNSLFGLAYYITHNFSQFIRLAGLKTVAFFGLTRSYYSRFHNLGLILFFYPMHAAALASTGWWLRQHLKKWLFLFSVILMTWVTVVLTCDDWHNRFYLNLVPVLILLALPAFHWVLRRGRWPSPPND